MSGEKIVIERTYKASLQDVWDLWTTKEGFESWWGPQGFRADVYEMDARQGGTLRYDMVADSPEMIAAMKQMGRPVSSGVSVKFAALKPQSHLVLKSVIDFLPGVEPYENDIAVDFTPVGDGVRMVITLSPYHSEDFTKMAVQGMTSQVGKLDARFG